MERRQARRPPCHSGTRALRARGLERALELDTPVVQARHDERYPRVGRCGEARARPRDGRPELVARIGEAYARDMCPRRWLRPGLDAAPAAFKALE